MSSLLHNDPRVFRRAVAGWSARRFAAATGLIGALGALASFSLVLASRPSDVFGPLFSGWQLDLVEAATAIVLVAMAVACAYSLRRLSHARAELGAYRRLALLFAILPGLLLGSGLYYAADRAVIWASDHTAQADADRTLRASYRLAPPKITSRYPPAPVELASRVLTSADFGSGWYDVTDVNPVSMPLALGATNERQIASVRSAFGQEHRTDSETWVPDTTVFEDLRTFDSAAHANSYLDSWTTAHKADLLSNRTIGSVSVTQGSTRSGQLAAFATGSAVFTLDTSWTSASAAASRNEFNELVRAAVSRATSNS